jgi:3-hydroxyacyl-[acyl-carrier-protein] dehydratase
MMDLEAIKETVPHRPPFLFVDEVTEISDQRIVAHRRIRSDEYFFAGHFPGEPIMPGVLIIEAMAQTGAVMIMKRFKDSIPLFMAIDGVKFRRIIKPGDTLTMEVKMLNDRGKIVKMAGTVKVGDEPVCEAIFLAGIKSR